MRWREAPLRPMTPLPIPDSPPGVDSPSRAWQRRIPKRSLGTTKLERLDNGFIIFRPEMFAMGNLGAQPAPVGD